MTRKTVRRTAFAGTLLFVCVALGVRAQEAPAAGEYVGSLGPLSLRLHIEAAADGALTCRLDSPNQGAFGLPCADFVLDGRTLSFRVPSVSGTWKGTVDDGGATLSGTWLQGVSMPLDFRRDTFLPASAPSAVDGIWLGTSQFQGQNVRTQLIVRSDAEGKQSCFVDSPDLNVFELACANVSFSNGELEFEVPSVQSKWKGKLSADGRSLEGTWTQTASGASASTPLSFTRQSERIRPALPTPVTFDPAIDPVRPADMQAVLRRDLEKTFTSGLLAPGKPTGVAVAVVRNGERSVFGFGTAWPDSVFEIGSITKTFTGLLMAQMVEHGQVKPETPVRELLPTGIVAKPAGAEITLLDLVTQRSGLPRLPGNFAPSDMANPYAEYRADNLYQLLAQHGLARPEKPQFLYSNLGLGLLGHALALRAGTGYADALKKYVLEPLGMNDTAIALSADQHRRFMPAYSADLRAVQPWEFDALAGAGALRSTAVDLLKFLEANLRPESAGGSRRDRYARTLPAAIRRSQQLQAEIGPGGSIAYAWLYDARTGTYWHNGGTGGYSSYAFFNPKENYAGVVLVNVAVSTRGSFADQLGQHVRQRLAGEPAISLSGW